MTTTKTLEKRAKAPETTVNEHTYTPKVDIWETANSFHIVSEMPGVEKDGVNVKLEEGILTILGRVQPINHDGYELAYSEYNIGNFEREFRISDDINETNIKAIMANGVLTLELPKKETAKPKQIEVKVG